LLYYYPFNTPLYPQVCGSAWPAGLGTSAAVRQETWGFWGHFLMGMSCDLIDKKVMNMAEFTSPTTGISPSNQ